MMLMQDRIGNREGLSVAEAVEFSGIRRSKIFELIASGDLPARKAGSKTLILRSELLAFLSTLPRMNITRARAPNPASQMQAVA